MTVRATSSHPEAWTAVAAGDLDALENLFDRASAVQLVEQGQQLTGAQAARAIRRTRAVMPDLTVSGRVDAFAPVTVAWLSFRGLPWLRDREVHGVVRAGPDGIVVVGTFESALLHAQQAEQPDGASQLPHPLHPNALLLRAGYDAPGIHAKVFTEDFVAHTLGHNRTAGDWHGAEKMAEHLALILELTQGTIKVTPLTRFAIANDRFGVVFSRATAEREGQRVDQYVCGVWRFEEGRIAEHWEIFSEPAAWDAFFGDATA